MEATPRCAYYEINYIFQFNTAQVYFNSNCSQYMCAICKGGPSYKRCIIIAALCYAHRLQKPNLSHLHGG